MNMRFGVVTALCAVLTATTAAAQETCGRYEETLGSPRYGDATFVARDLNGTTRVREQIVTQRSGTDGRNEVVTETYRPSIEAGRLALSRRVRRVTTRTSDGSQIVEEIERPNHGAPSDPPRVTERIVTTVRQSGTGVSIERQMFERDINGRFDLVCTESQRTSGN